MSKAKRILLMMGRHGEWHELVLGIADYALHRPDWVLDVVAPGPGVIETIDGSDWDGVITHMNTLDTYRTVREWGIPTVNTSQDLPLADMPDIAHTAVDNELIGHWVAQYYLERGLSQFAFLGWAGHINSQQRRRGFCDHLAERAISPALLELEAPPIFGPVERSDNDQILIDWLKTLPASCGLFACNDAFAFRANRLCGEAGIRIPEALCIVGVYNDQLICQLGRPPLSSVELFGRREGWDAARLLDTWLQSGRLPEPNVVQHPPARLVARQSSDLLTVTDPHVAKALAFMQRRMAEELSVNDIVRHVGVNRRTLERHFAMLLRRSPNEELRRVRVERAKQLLVGTNLPMSRIAEQCGFCASQYMSVVFRKQEGVSPTSYRQAYSTWAAPVQPFSTGKGAR